MGTIRVYNRLRAHTQLSRNEGGGKMKKVLTKKVNVSSKAIKYFTNENSITTTIVTVDTTCYLVVGVASCPC